MFKCFLCIALVTIVFLSVENKIFLYIAQVSNLLHHRIMTQFLRFCSIIFFLFFGFNTFAQSNITKLEKSTSNLKHIKSKKLILVTPTTVVKQEGQQDKYPEKPRKEKQNTEKIGLKPLKSQQPIIDEKNSPK